MTSFIPFPGSNSVTFTATISGSGVGRTGMVSFWDSTNFVWQGDYAGTPISITITNFTAGPHAIVARYFSDTTYASSSSAVVGVRAPVNQMQTTEDGTFVLGFTNVSGAPFTVLSSTNVLSPSSEWMVLGQASEVIPGQFQYSDQQALNRDSARFYRLRSP